MIIVLGGQSFNDQLFNYIINFLSWKCPDLNVLESPEQIGIINDLIEKAKIELSMKTTVDFEFNDVFVETTIVANIPPAKRGEPHIEFVLSVDDKGIFNSTYKKETCFSYKLTFKKFIIYHFIF